jgi:large subunit ribosomal protein L2
MLNFLYKKCLKIITKGKVSKGGRNFLGRVCVLGRSFLKRRLFINVNFIRRLNILGFLCKYIYDVNRTSKVGLLMFTNGLMSCVILSDKMRLGDVAYSGLLSANSKFKVFNGDAVPLKSMPLFSVLHNVELKPQKGAQIMRAGGSSCIFIGKVKDKAILKLNSG